MDHIPDFQFGDIDGQGVRDDVGKTLDLQFVQRLFELATVGGLFTLGGAVGLATGAETSGAPLAHSLLGLTIIGVAPLLGGIVLFGLGLRLLSPPRR